MEKAREMWTLAYQYQDRTGAELLAHALEDYGEELGKKAHGEADHQKAQECFDRATSIWHDIVRWHDEDHPLSVKENPDTGDYETDEYLTY